VSLIRLGSSFPRTNSAMNLRYLYALSPGVSSVQIFSLKKGHSRHTATYDFGAVAKGLKFNAVNLAGAALYMI
jgi:hypothetical protein